MMYISLKCLSVWTFVNIVIGSVLVNKTEFERISDEFWEWRLRDNPEFASNVGDHRYTDQLEDYSIAQIDRRKEQLTAYLERLNAIDRNGLEPATKVSYDVLKDTIRSWLDGYEWRFYGPMNPINFLEGIQTNYGSRASQVKFEAEDDFRKFAERTRQFGVQIGQIMERMNKSIDMGTTHHNASMIKVPGSFDEMLAYRNNVTAFPIYKPYEDDLPSVVFNATKRTEIQNLAKQNIEFLLDRAAVMKDYIVNVYMPNTRRTLGVHGLPRGQEYYQATLKWQLSMDISADEIHKKGLAEVERINSELTKIVKRANFKGTNREYFDFIRQNSSLFEDDPDDAMALFRNMYSTRIVPKLTTMFKNIPNMPLEIEKMSFDGANGLYKNGAPDGSRPGIFFANVHNPVPKFDMMALMLHETDPGHHLQDAYALSAPDIPMFRRATDFSKYFASPMHFPFYSAYSEGWALYSEDLGSELNVFKDDLERLGKYGLEIFRAARLVVDTGIHSKAWTKEQAVSYMMNYTAYPEQFIAKEIDRYATWPGQACSYKIGSMKIWELRKRAEEKLCDKFDIKAFHSVILTNGAMPLWVMDNLVNDWIEKTQQEHGIHGNCEVSGTEQTYTSSDLLVFILSLLSFVVNR